MSSKDKNTPDLPLTRDEHHSLPDTTLHNRLSKIRHSSQPTPLHQPHRGMLRAGGKSVGVSSSEKKQERVLGALSTNPFSFHLKCALKDHCLPIILSFKLLHLLSRIGHKRHPTLFLAIQNSIF